VLFPAADAVGPTGRVVGIDIAARMAEFVQADAKLAGSSTSPRSRATPSAPTSAGSRSTPSSVAW
jgi:hypothetical protein